MDSLIKTLKNGNDGHIRANLLIFLEKSMIVGSRSTVLALKDDEDWQVREESAEALAKLKNIRAVEPLNLALTDKNWHVQKSAVALGEFKNTSSIAPLSLALDDEVVSVQISAFKLLRSL